MNNAQKQTLVSIGFLAVGGAAAFIAVRKLYAKENDNMKAPLRRSVLPYAITPSTISNRFRSDHRGIDIKTRAKDSDPTKPDPNGVPTVGIALIAPFDGIVDRRFTNDLGGLQMIIKSADGFSMGFAHLQDAIPLGASFSAGDVIGATGNSGTKPSGEGYPPHLHLTLRDPSGVILDPAPFFGV